MQAADPHMLDKYNEQRLELQRLGYISQRKYPAQIIVAASGKYHDAARNIPDTVFVDPHRTSRSSRTSVGTRASWFEGRASMGAMKYDSQLFLELVL